MSQQKHSNAMPVENPLLKSTARHYTLERTQFHSINLICSVCERTEFSVQIISDSFFCYCTSCGVNHQLSAYKGELNANQTVAELLVKQHQPTVEVVEDAA